MERPTPATQVAHGPCHFAIGEDDSDELNEPADEKDHSGSDQGGWLERENKKRRISNQSETVFEGPSLECKGSEGSDPKRFEDLVLPYSQSRRKGEDAPLDEAEKEQAMDNLVQGWESMQEMDEADAQNRGHKLVQVAHSEWAQELREVRKKFADDVASEMTEVKNDLAHVRELLGVLVRRERSAETRAEIAARRLDRMEREKDEADDAEHEANLQEALTNQSKAVKVLVDKWFVDKGYGFGKAPTGEIAFIHASAVRGAEVLTIGTEAWVQVVNDDARAQGGYRAKRAWGRNAWKAERDKENANKVAQQVKRAAALTAELAAQSEKKTAAVCDQPPGLDELAGHIEAPNMEAGGSHPQAAVMPDPWATHTSLRRRRPNHDRCSS